MLDNEFDEKKNNKTKIIVGILILVILVAGGFLIKEEFFKEEPKKDPKEPTPTVTPEATTPVETVEPTTSPDATQSPSKPVQKTGNYNVDIIKNFNTSAGKSNYLLSPYNIEIALNMLREGADGNTKDELDKVLGNRVINDVSVKDKVGIANAIFVKDVYKDNVKKEYYSILDSKYNSEVIYDKFTTPDKINNWVKEKTNGMIKKILDSMSEDFVMGIASALAVDVKWQSDFDCNNTRSEEFTKVDNKKINVEMMHKSYERFTKYIKGSDYEGIIIPYMKEDDSKVELEFIGIIPNDNVDSFVNNLTSEKLNNIANSSKEASDKYHINVSLPRFTYDYEAGDFKQILKKMGINEVFDPLKANLKKMVEIDGYNTYVNTAIHKTYIEVTEKGTKAAAVTYFGVDKSSAMIQDVERVNIKFNKPFVYMIRERNTGEILFFGTVYEPNKWNKSTCESK